MINKFIYIEALSHLGASSFQEENNGESNVSVIILFSYMHSQLMSINTIIRVIGIYSNISYQQLVIKCLLVLYIPRHIKTIIRVTGIYIPKYRLSTTGY